MTFLTIDGATIEIVKGGGHKEIVDGNTGTEFNGGPLREHRHTKREWSLSTPVRASATWQHTIGHVTGLGQQWHFDSDTTSTKGLGPKSTAVATIIPGEDLQSPPKKVYQESSGELEAYFGAGALEMGPATENELAADIRDCEDYTAFGSLTSATLSDEATIKLEGTQSVKTVTTAAVGSGIRSGFFTLDATTEYTFSCYVYATSALSLRIEIHDGAGVVATNAFTTTANSWVRVEVTGTTSGSPTSGGRVALYTMAASVVTFYTDMWQIEEQPQATPWVDGTRAAQQLRYDNLAPLSDCVSFACWTRPPATNPTDAPILFWCGESGKDALQIYRQASTNDIAVRLLHDGNAVIYQGDTGLWDDAWHHIGVTLNPQTLSVRVYVDGVRTLNQTTTTTYYPYLKDMADLLYIGGASGASGYWRGPICEAFCVPYEMTVTQMAALAARTTQTPGLPKVDLGGTCNPYAVTGQNYPVIGRFESASYGNAGDPDDYSRAGLNLILTSCEDY